MAFVEAPDGSGHPRLDGLAILYLCISIFWTALLIGGIIFLIINRKVQCVRIRNLPLSIASVACLHLYELLVINIHSLNGTFPCATEYWVMSIYLPLGIALFQASNIQLLSVANTQNRMLSHSKEMAFTPKPNTTRSLRGFWERYQGMNLLKKTYVAIAAGMVVQIIVSTVVYLTSRKFVPFGVFSEHVDPAACRCGTEWIPSILWQLLWAWVFAPYVLWKIRHIKDVHHWRLQTIVCIVAGLPGSPMWLISLYSKTETWAQIATFWVPPFWFMIPMITMQAVTIFVPCVEVLRSRSRQQYVTRVLRDWEERRWAADNKSLSSSTPSSVPSSKQTMSSTNSCRSGMYSRLSFEKYLGGGDSAQLLHFAASREFTGENIMFLNYVRDWKASWDHMRQAQAYESNPDLARYRAHFFKVAVEIYADYVDLKSAEFPINIESPIYVQLAKMFGDASRLLDKPQLENSVSPFVFDRSTEKTVTETGTVLQVTTYDLKSPSTTIEHAMQPWTKLDSSGPQRSVMTLEPRLPDNITVPDGFGPDVFDRAEESVKHMVYLNTWPKFVDVTVEESSIIDGGEQATKTWLSCFKS